jgi:RNA polymerase sigma factor (sigma-70 family)
MSGIQIGPQTLSNEVTTKQIETVLDFLIDKAIYAIMRSSNFMDILMASALAWKTENPRRKISAIDRGEVTALLFHYTCLQSVEQKKEVLKLLHLERSFLLFACMLYMNTMKKYVDLSNELVRLRINHKNTSDVLFQKRQFESAFQLTPESYSAYYEVALWHQNAVEFRAMIFSRYMKLVLKESARHFKLSKQTLDYNDLIQNLIVGVYKAIDKFDSSRGTITSYIQQWIMASKLQRSHEYGVAYYIPDSKKRAIAGGTSSINNMYVSLDEVDNEQRDDTIEEYEEANRIRRLAKRVDRLGLARYALGIQEALTPKEMESLKHIYAKVTSGSGYSGCCKV